MLGIQEVLQGYIFSGKIIDPIKNPKNKNSEVKSSTKGTNLPIDLYFESGEGGGG